MQTWEPWAQQMMRRVRAGDEELAYLLDALFEIAQGRGRFSVDQHEFACNTIDDMKSLAREALRKAGC